MAATTAAEEEGISFVEKRYAVVTGANKGIGFGICKELVAKGIVVVLTARDEKRGIDAVEKLKSSGFSSSENVLFHKLDVSDSSSVISLARFINSQFGKLDILVNNAGVGGTSVDIDALKASIAAGEVPNVIKYSKQTYESANEAIQINYYGAKNMIEAFIPLLQKSKSPRIVNVTSTMGQLKDVGDGHTKEILSDVENLNENKIDEVLEGFLEDLKNNALVAKGWSSFLPVYTLTKAALNSYTRIVAKKYPNMKVNSVCPGFVKTDMNFNTGILSVEDGAVGPVKLALLDDDGPSGFFFRRDKISDF